MVARTYCRSPAFEKLKERTKPSYRYQIRIFADIPTRDGRRLGDLPAKSITPAAVDRIYETLRGGKEGNKLRRANHTIDIAKKAWTVVQRTHPHQFVQSNPFVGLTRFRSKATIQHATRAEAFALSDAHQSLRASRTSPSFRLFSLQWLQRPENVLAGHLRWSRPGPRNVRGIDELAPSQDGRGCSGTPWKPAENVLPRA